MADSYGQFTLWVSVYHLLKSEPSCTSHKPRASYQRWLVRGDLEHEISPYAATQSYIWKLRFLHYIYCTVLHIHIAHILHARCAYAPSKTDSTLFGIDYFPFDLFVLYTCYWYI